MTLDTIQISGGRANLGSWGRLELTGAASALLRLNWSENVELPEVVAADITAGVLLLNEEIGRLLFLPYADLCLERHKSAYADSGIMPRRGRGCWAGRRCGRV